MTFIQNIDLDTLVSLTAAFILDGLIGFERQYRQHTAGLRTNVLVAVGVPCSWTSPTASTDSMAATTA